MKNRSSNRSDLSEEQRALVEKTEEILGAGGFNAETFGRLITGFHQELCRRKREAGAPAETGAGNEGEELPAEDKSKRIAHLTTNQADRFRDGMDHLDTIYEILMQSGGDHFAGISSLLRHPKEIFEELEREFDAAHEAIQVEKVEKEEASVC